MTTGSSRPSTIETHASRWVLDALTSGAVAFDTSFRVAAWNRTMTEWTGLVSEQAYGRDLFEAIPRLGQPRFRLRLEDVVRGGPATMFDSLLHDSLLEPGHARTEARRLRVSVNTWYDEQARERFGLIVFEDVSDLHHLEAETRASRDRAMEQIAQHERTTTALRQQTDHLASVNDDLQQFAYMASHDLREPLHKIRMFARLLEDDVRDLLDGEALDMVRRIGSATERLEGLLGESLALLRAGEAEDEPGPVDMSRIVEDALEDLESRVEEADAVVDVDELPSVLADSVSLHHLMLNLLSNALKFRHPDRRSRVTVQAAVGSLLTAEGELDAARIIVSDNGIGFDPRYASEIFKPFRRLHGRSDSYGGHGLGLAICRRIVRRLGGQIWAESRHDHGSAFHVVLPVARASADAPAAEPADAMHTVSA